MRSPADCALVTLMLISALASAQWVQTSGPRGGTVSAITVSGSGNVFAATDGGVFLSTDNGVTWALTALSDIRVHAITGSGSTIFAGTYGSGVYRTTNNGISWINSVSGLSNPLVWSLVVSGSVLLAGTESGVFRSTNNGISWAQKAARDTSGDAAFYDAARQVVSIVRGAPLSQVESYISREGMAIVSDTAMTLRDLLSSRNRESLVREDSTRQGASIQARSDKTYDGAYIVIKTLDAQKRHPRYHSFTLFKEPEHGWQIFLWHVGE